MNRGSISVFLALLLSVSLLFSLALLEDARVAGMKTRLEMAGESALDSLFAAYDGDLFDEFGILALSEEKLPGELTMDEDIENHLEKELNPQTGHLLLSGNLFKAELQNVWVTDTWSLTDRGGELFIRDAVDYMKYSLAGAGIEEIMSQIELMGSGEEALKEEAAEREESADAGRTEAGESEDETTFEEATRGSWLERVREIQEKGWLDLIIPIEKAASSYETKKAGFPSEEYLTYARFFESPGSCPVTTQLLFGEYLLESFTCFTTVKKAEGMQYQLEYILCGKKTDRKNLEGTVLRLLLIREGLNYLSLMSSAAMRKKTEAAAMAIAGWTGIAPVILLVQSAVAVAWSFCEAIVDLRTLLGSGKVPLLKNEAEWTVTLENISLLLDGDNRLGARGDKGLDYPAYLRLALFAKDMQTKAYRAMDVIQEVIRQKRPGFRVEDCVYAVTVRVTAVAEALFVNTGSSWYGFGCTLSRMY